VTAVDARPQVTTRPQAEHRSFPTLDSYRALAALAVVATHVGFQTAAGVEGPLAPVVSRLDIGVAIFFVLSGFLLYRPWSLAALRDTRGPATVPYLWRRALRIVPAYLVVVAAAMLLVRGNEGRGIDEWLRQLFLVQIYHPGALVPGLTQMWSLGTEVAFYVALPLLAWLATRRHRGHPARSARFQATVLGAYAVAGVGFLAAVRAAGVLDPRTASLWLPAHLDWFAVGMVLAVASAYVAAVPAAADTSGWRVLAGAAHAPGAAWGVALGVFLVATTPLAGPRTLDDPTAGQAVAKHVLYAVVAGFLLLPGTLGPRHGTWATAMTARPLARLGTISYGIFLWHLVVLDLVFVGLGRDFFTGGFWTVLALTVAGTVAVAALSWRVVEQPALQLKDRGPGRRRARAEVTSPPR
jgi:peptidoglycan/LPS O-acetylase OafA/YrhL